MCCLEHMSQWSGNKYFNGLFSGLNIRGRLSSEIDKLLKKSRTKFTYIVVCKFLFTESYILGSHVVKKEMGLSERQKKMCWHPKLKKFVKFIL